MKTELFNQVNAESIKFKENNDCTVIAATIVTGASYAEVHKRFKNAGRKKGRGTYDPMQREVLEQLGAKIDEWEPRKKNGGRYSVRTIGKVLHTGKHYVFIKRHALAVVDGEVHDWSNGRLHEVEKVWTITMPGDEPYELERPTTDVPKPTRARGVYVSCEEENPAWGITLHREYFSSVYRAFDDLDLDVKAHQKFRFNLKRTKAGRLEYVEAGVTYIFETTYYA